MRQDGLNRRNIDPERLGSDGERRHIRSRRNRGCDQLE
jgi:hypothetical protein